MALPSAELPRTAGPVYLHPVAAPLEGVSARRTFGTLISAGRNRISLLRLGASGDFAVCCRAWRLPAAHKKHWRGLPTASSAARPGVGLLSAGGGHQAFARASLYPRRASSSQSSWPDPGRRSAPLRACHRRSTTPLFSSCARRTSGCGKTARAASCRTRRARPGRRRRRPLHTCRWRGREGGACTRSRARNSRCPSAAAPHTRRLPRGGRSRPASRSAARMSRRPWPRCFLR